MIAVYSVFIAVCVVVGYLFNLVAIVTLIHAKTFISRGLFISAVLPFGVWLFCVGAIIGATIAMLREPERYSPGDAVDLYRVLREIKAQTDGMASLDVLMESSQSH